MARGDHIYVRRFGGVYGHHGIDMGDSTVIHYTSSSWLTPRQVRRTTIEQFARGDEILVRDYQQFFDAVENGDIFDRASQGLNQVLDQLRGLQVKELDFADDAVTRRAESRLGEYAFDTVFNNCEHFASWCKTGISNSQQVTDLWRMALTGGNFIKYRTSEILTNAIEYPQRFFKQKES